MRILGLSTITNINDPDNPLPATVEDIIAVAKNVVPMLEKIIQQVVENVHEETIS
jgi:purine-nucleoside phosphorylase